MLDLPALRLQVAQAVRQAQPGLNGEALAAALRPVTYLVKTTQPARSHRGGVPHLDGAWPHWNGQPMRFLLELSLPELAPYDPERTWPHVGWLSFFLTAGSVSDAPLDACRVISTPEDTASPVPPPAGLPRLPAEPLTFATGLHSTPQGYEFADLTRYHQAYEELEALNYQAVPPEIEALREEDYLLGQQLYAHAAGVEVARDPPDVLTRRDGPAHRAVRALLTLRGTQAPDDHLLSLTFFLSAHALSDWDFSKAVVDDAAS